MITIGKRFYIGSSQNLKKRKAAHALHLRKGNHANIVMQRTYNKNGSFEFKVIFKCQETDVIKEEQNLLDAHFNDPLCMNISSNAFSAFCCPKNRAATAKMNKERIWTQEMRQKSALARKGTKMQKGIMDERSERWTGVGNPNAKLCSLDIDEILKRRKMGHQISLLAKEFCVNRTTITRVCAKFGVYHKPENWSEAMRSAQLNATKKNPKRYSRDVRGNKNPRHIAKKAALIAEYGRTKNL